MTDEEVRAKLLKRLDSLIDKTTETLGLSVILLTELSIMGIHLLDMKKEIKGGADASNFEMKNRITGEMAPLEYGLNDTEKRIYRYLRFFRAEAIKIVKEE